MYLRVDIVTILNVIRHYHSSFFGERHPPHVLKPYFHRMLSAYRKFSGVAVVRLMTSVAQMLQALCLENDKGQARRVVAEMRERGVKPDK